MTAVGVMCVFFLFLIGGAAVWIGKLGEKIKDQQKAIDSLESIAKHHREYIDNVECWFPSHSIDGIFTEEREGEEDWLGECDPDDLYSQEVKR